MLGLNWFHRLTGRQVLVGLVILLTACGTSSSASTLPAAATVAARGCPNTGSAALVHDSMGGLWKLSVCRPKLVSDVQWSAQNGVSSDLGAVEGEAYLTIVLHLTNAATDRSETFPIPSLSASPPDDFQLWVPTALCAKKSGPFFASCYPPITLKPDYSPLINEHFWIIPFPGFADAGIAVKPIQPGDEVDLFIADWEPMPVTAPMAQVTAHWVGPDNSQNIAVPVTE